MTTKRTMTLNLTDAEMSALDELSARTAGPAERSLELQLRRLLERAGRRSGRLRTP